MPHRMLAQIIIMKDMALNSNQQDHHLVTTDRPMLVLHKAYTEKEQRCRQ